LTRNSARSPRRKMRLFEAKILRKYSFIHFLSS
jgi:hypothetical protein